MRGGVAVRRGGGRAESSAWHNCFLEKPGCMRAATPTALPQWACVDRQAIQRVCVCHGVCVCVRARVPGRSQVKK